MQKINEPKPKKLCRKGCGAEIRNNRFFYDQVWARFRITWDSLKNDPHRKGEIIEALREDGIYPTLNLDGTPHICGQVKQQKPAANQEIQELIKNFNKFKMEIMKRFDEFENSVSSKILFQLQQYLKR